MSIFKRIFLLLIVLIIIGGFAIYKLEPEYAYMPPEKKLLNPSALRSAQNKHSIFYDVWGKTVTQDEADNLKTTENGQRLLSADNGAVEVNSSLLKLGRTTFYQETFGSEVFLTDIMGIVDGAFTIPNIAKAILRLKGEGTTNLKVELAEDVTLGDKTYKKGTPIDTGIDVPKGTYTPLGMPIKFSEGRLKVGISCAVCHSTVDPDTKLVVEGAPNSDLNSGLLLALASNSTAYFTHAQTEGVIPQLKNNKRTIIASNGKTEALPDPEALEKLVDATFSKWPPGNFDSTIDMKSNPAQIPDSFTLGDHPYGWSGFASAGPFKGLSTFSQNVHAQNSDSLSQADASGALFETDKEVYLGTILQNSASPKYRFSPENGQKPSEFFASVDPTPGSPGVNELIPSPSYPKVSLISPDGLLASSPGHRVWEQINGVAAWQNTLVPPNSKEQPDSKNLDLGKSVFNRAGCIRCHSGETFTNNRVISVKDIGTEPSRAKALKKTERIFGESLLYPPNTPVPLSKEAPHLEVPTDGLDPEQIKLAFAHGDSEGGYKVPSLIGLYWSAPYLHDGGVAVGKDVQNQLGISGTLMKGISPDPENSLRGLLDKKLRDQVVKANQISSDLQSVHVKGIGHEFWVDSTTGFTQEEQDALIQYLLFQIK